MKALIQVSEPLATIREAASHEEAVAAVAHATFDIAFLDVDLKEQRTGLDFLRHIRSLDLDTRAIMLSGRVEKELVMTCIEAGASGYILKDMDAFELDNDGAADTCEGREIEAGKQEIVERKNPVRVIEGIVRHEGIDEFAEQDECEGEPNGRSGAQAKHAVGEDHDHEQAGRIVHVIRGERDQQQHESQKQIRYAHHR
ncbi:MAG: response regulator [Stellaceae bacterium]